LKNRLGGRREKGKDWIKEGEEVKCGEKRSVVN